MKLAVGLLEDEFELRQIASREFPPEVSPTHIRSPISRYEDELSAAYERSICCSCSSFFTGYIYQIDDRDDFIALHQSSLDRCGYHGNLLDFL